MGTFEISGFWRPLLAVLTGMMLGVLLDKGRLTKHQTIVGQFLLKDFTMLKIMMSALLVGSIGLHILSSAGIVNLHISPFVPRKLLAGSVLFGIGMAVLGYWPGSGAGAVCTGKIDALLGIFSGGLTASAIYAGMYPLLNETFLQGEIYKFTTISELIDLNQGLVIVILSLMISAILFAVKLLERKRKVCSDN